MTLRLEWNWTLTQRLKLMDSKNEDRTFGLVKCYPVIIDNEVKGALVTAMRSHYDASVLEIIAPVCLRKAFGLKDGNKVKIEIYTQTS